MKHNTKWTKKEKLKKIKTHKYNTHNCDSFVLIDIIDCYRITTKISIWN